MRMFFEGYGHMMMQLHFASSTGCNNVVFSELLQGIVLSSKRCLCLWRELKKSYNASWVIAVWLEAYSLNVSMHLGGR